MSPMHRPVGKGDHVFLVDGSNFIFRAYFQSINQDRKYNVRSDGLPTGAVRLFATKLLQFVQEGAAGVKPTHLAIVFDKSENSFRKEIYPAYKANRSAPPEDLVPQFPLMRETVRAFGLVPVEQDVYEADDLIATYAKQAVERGADVTIISADKDLMQLIGPGVSMYDPASGKDGAKGARDERMIKRDEVIAYFGVPPEKVVDVQSLAGDSTDNVPGAPGIGIKTAAQLIQDYGDLDTLLARASEIKQPKRRETLTDPEIVEKIRLSRRLVSLVDDVPVLTSIDDLGLASPDPKALVAFLKAMEFRTITNRVAQVYEIDPAEVEPDPRLARGGEAVPARPASAEAEEQPSPDAAAHPGPAGLAAARAAAIRAVPFAVETYECVRSLERLEAWVARGREAGIVAFDTETNALDAVACDLVGFSLAVAPGEACYVPLLHRGGSDLFGGGLLSDQIDTAKAMAALRPLMEDPAVLKIGQNVKFDWLVLSRYGLDVAPTDDTMLMSYVLDAGRGSHGMDDLAERHLGHRTIRYSEVAGTGKNAITFDCVPLDKATAYAAEDADVTLRLWLALKPRLAAEGRVTVYETLERGMPAVLARMERRGIQVDRQILSRLSAEFAQSLARLESEIHEMAGETFSLGSPKQIGDILFGKMGLPGAKKTPTGQWATPASLLDELAEQGHELPARILEWRQLAKLKSTYTDSLPGYMDGEGRVHTCFSLAATTTGRLSSSEPNLQNIPIRTEAGRKIRTAFIAKPGYKIVSADYSQIELRLLAHIADIPQLQKAFAEGQDIHAATASEMFGVPLDQMTGDLRRQAKTINFGIIYGISAFGLAARLGIPNSEASAFIKRYFERFPGIKTYMDDTKKFCREHGYVRTLFGRICHYPAIRSPNPSERAGVERQAINAPIQGTAADIIRRAMMRMEDAFEEAKLSGRMLLQVHDELVFEVPEDEVEATLPVVSRVMNGAPHPAIALKVPLQVDARAASNWDEAH